MSQYTNIDEWSEYWLNEFRNNRSLWVEDGLDDFQFTLVFDSPELRDAAWKDMCDFWDGGGWGEPDEFIDYESNPTVLGVYITCPETPLLIRIAKNYGGKIYHWNSKFIEEPPKQFPYWIPSDYRLALYEKRKKGIPRKKGKNWDYFDLKSKQKKAIIAVCTLGLSVAPISYLWKERNLSKGTSWEKYEGIRIVVNGTFFICSTLVCAIILWIIWLIKLIYYSIELNKLKK